jgi:predicted metal-dependent hydrolase
VNDLYEENKDKDEYIRLYEKFNPEHLSETGKNNRYTSYSVNKGEKIVLCLRQKNETEELVKENLLLFVALHELAHIMTKSIGHTQEFWDNFKVLLKQAIDKGIYYKEDYQKNPEDYCGIKVTDTPLN